MFEEMLLDNPLFNDMDQDELCAALNDLDARCQRYEKGEMILRAGSPCTHLCLVLTGSVTIENNDIWGNRTILNIIGQGGLFAESYAVLSEATLLVDAAASTPCQILMLRVSGLFAPGTDERPWSAKLLRNLLRISANKNLLLSQRAFHISAKTARGRILSYLNAVALETQRKTFDIPFDRQQMADYLNLERTALSKELGRMKREQIIDFKKNHFQILS